jgi:uncharacterized protein (DUF1330 family)
MPPKPDEIDALIADFAMHGGLGGVNPSEDQLRGVLAAPDGPVQMINLLKFRARADYPADYSGGESTDVSGEEAYSRYGANTMPHVAQRGGRLVLLSQADESVIGNLGDWDQVAIVEYPNRDAFIEMGRDPDYLAGTVHRTAALERTAIIATTPVIDASNPGG